MKYAQYQSLVKGQSQKMFFCCKILLNDGNPVNASLNFYLLIPKIVLPRNYHYEQ